MAAVGGEDRPVLLRNARVWQWEDDGIDAAGAGTGTAMAGRADAAGAGKGWRGAFTSPRGWLRLTRAGTIAAVGDGATDAAEGERVVDLDGAYVLPGLIDAHCHVRMTGEARLEVPLGGCAGLEELQRRVNDFCARERADAADDKPGVVGSGWDQDSLGCTPTAADVDAAEAARPVFLWRACFHVGVANTAALRAAGLLDSDPADDDVGADGRSLVVRDVEGRPTGLLREGACERVMRHLTDNSPEGVAAAIKAGLLAASQAGLTAVQTNCGGCWDVYCRLADEGELPVRVFLTVPATAAAEGRAPAAGATPRGSIGAHSHAHTDAPTGALKDEHADAHSAAHAGVPMLRCDRVKFFADGSLGAMTAALREPYVVEDSAAGEATKGTLIHAPETLAANVAAATKAGYRVELHCIGDAAAAAVLDALEAAEVPREARPVMTHCQVLGTDLFPRMAAAGAVANVQPSFVVTDMAWVQRRLSPALQASAYAWRSLMEYRAELGGEVCGIAVAGGSDAPVESFSPLQGMHDAMARGPRPGDAGDSGEVYRPEECLSFAEALGMYTRGAAFAACAEQHLGRLRAGAPGDLTVIALRDDDELGADAAKSGALLHARVLQAWVAGRKRFDAADAEAAGAGASSRPWAPGRNGERRPCRCCR